MIEVTLPDAITQSMHGTIEEETFVMNVTLETQSSTLPLQKRYPIDKYCSLKLK